ncbi:hypothetical protein Bca101_021877 [Brassica carinata]
MDFFSDHFSKARTLRLSKNLTRASEQILREGHLADQTDCPACVLFLTAMDPINPDLDNRQRVT